MSAFNVRNLVREIQGKFLPKPTATENGKVITYNDTNQSFEYNDYVGSASNLGTSGDGEGLFDSKSGVDLQFKRIKAGTNISLTSETNDVVINATGGGTGDVTGDTSSTDNAVARFDGITGKAIQNSVVTIDDSGSINIPTGQSYKINGTLQKLDDFGIPDDNTDLNATTTYHGLLPKLSGSATEFLNGNGTFSTPAGGSSTWTQITDFTATPASTNTITMTADLTGSISVRDPLKYIIGGVTYYGIVSAITSTLISISGAPLSGTITSLYYGDPTRTKTECIVVNGYYADASNATLIETDLFMNDGFVWTNTKAYVVQISYLHAVNDSGATQPAINLTIAGSDLLSPGRSVSTTYSSSNVGINTANYDVNYGESIEIEVTAGTNGDAHDLVVYIVAVYP